jgi:hypothetical protein
MKLKFGENPIVRKKPLQKLPKAIRIRRIKSHLSPLPLLFQPLAMRRPPFFFRVMSQIPF